MRSITERWGHRCLERSNTAVVERLGTDSIGDNITIASAITGGSSGLSHSVLFYWDGFPIADAPVFLIAVCSILHFLCLACLPFQTFIPSPSVPSGWLAAGSKTGSSGWLTAVSYKSRAVG